MNYASVTYEAFYLLTTSEYYWNSVLLSAKLSTSLNLLVKDNTVAFLRANFGSIWNFWLFKATETTATNYYAAQNPDKIAMVGTRYGKGTLVRGTIINEATT